jgi:hypothetical protein
MNLPDYLVINIMITNTTYDDTNFDYPSDVNDPDLDLMYYWHDDYEVNIEQARQTINQLTKIVIRNKDINHDKFVLLLELVLNNPTIKHFSLKFSFNADTKILLMKKLEDLPYIDLTVFDSYDDTIIKNTRGNPQLQITEPVKINIYDNNDSSVFTFD